MYHKKEKVNGTDIAKDILVISVLNYLILNKTNGSNSTLPGLGPGSKINLEDKKHDGEKNVSLNISDSNFTLKYDSIIVDNSKITYLNKTLHLYMRNITYISLKNN